MLQLSFSSSFVECSDLKGYEEERNHGPFISNQEDPNTSSPLHAPFKTLVISINWNMASCESSEFACIMFQTRIDFRIPVFCTKLNFSLNPCQKSLNVYGDDVHLGNVRGHGPAGCAGAGESAS